jgi:perosamine synthetase
VSDDFIPYTRPYIAPGDDEAVAEVVREGRLVMGQRVARFEAEVAAFVGRAHAIAVSSGTSALEVALRAHGVGPGWEVLVPAYTWVATYNVPRFLGARPVLVDVDPTTFCVSEASIRAALAAPSSGPRAALPVHLFGYRAGSDWLDELARDTGVLVIGDGCCAFGGADRGLRCGAWTPVECLSFHPRKVITTGEGGMVLTDDDAIAARIRRLRDHGAERSFEQRRQTTRGGDAVPQFPEPGLNLRMTELQGALGVRQMLNLDAILGGRRRVAATYDLLLRDAPEWLVPAPGADDPGRLLTFYVVRLADDRATLAELEGLRGAILADLADAGIAARPPMINLLDVPFTDANRDTFAGTERAARTAFALPFFPTLTEAACERVVAALLRSGTRRWNR